MLQLSLSFFGALQVQLTGRPIPHFRSANVQGLLAYLALHPDQALSRDVLATLFWPYDEDSRARKNLRQALYQLRQVLEDSDDRPEPFLLVTRQTIQLNPAGDIAVDVHNFQSALKSGDLATATGLYQGELLPGFTCGSLEFEEWLRLERERLHRLALGAMETFAGQQLAGGEWPGAEATARRQLALEPWRETAHRQLMVALARRGERSAALAQYETCVAVLEAEMGLEPEEETRALYQAIAAREFQPPEKHFTEHATREASRDPAGRQAEEILLAKVESFWIEGVYRQALGDGRLLEMEKEMIPAAVANPWQDVVPQPDAAPRPVPPEKSVPDLFTESGRSLLILGDPGSGKTVLLLELAGALVAQAKGDPQAPIPVVFNLSSWTNQALPLVEWLVAELNEKYLIPRKIGRDWLAADRLTLLLDGLDEVESDRQAACIQVINEFRLARGLVPIALTCRTQDYLESGVKLRFGGALRLEALSSLQVQSYLQASDAAMDELVQAIQEDRALQEMVQSPLMLQVMSKAFTRVGDRLRTRPETPLAASNHQRQESLLQTIFDAYVQQMLQQMAQTSAYRPEQAQPWLSWLANRLSAHNQTVFLIEGMQPDWLATRARRWLYLFITRLALGLGIGLILWLFGIIGGQMGVDDHSMSSLIIAGRVNVSIVWIDLVMSLIINLGYGFFVALIDIWFYERRMGAENPPPEDWLHKGVIALVVGLVAFLQLALWGERPDWTVLQVLVAVFMFVLLTHFAFGNGYENDIGTVEALSWSWPESGRGVLPAILAGAAFSVVIWQLVTATRTLPQVLFLVGLPIAILVFLLLGLRQNRIETKVAPNQGIRLSARNALTGGGLAGVVTGVLAAAGGLILSGSGLVVGSAFGLISGLVAALIAGLVYGGFNVFNHLVLRLILRRSGHIPRDFVPFLNEAVRHVLLYKVGGGYIFIHRLLQDHLAGRVEIGSPPPDEPVPARPVRLDMNESLRIP